MNRFFRTAYYTIYVYIYLVLFVVIPTGTEMPLPAFLCLFFGLFVGMIPDIFDGEPGKKPLFAVLGSLLALLGFPVLRLFGSGWMHYLGYGLGLLACLLLCLFGRQPTSHKLFMDSLRKTVILAAITIFIVLLVLVPVFIDGKLIDFGTEQLSILMGSLIPVIIMLLAVAVLHLRGLRSLQGGINRNAFRRRQLRDLLLFAAVVTIVYAFNPLAILGKGAAWIYNEALVPLLSLIAKALSDLFRNRFDFNWNFGHVYEYEDLEGNPTNPAEQMPQEEVVPTESMPDAAEPSNNVLYIAVVILVLAIVLIHFLMLRKRKPKRSGQGYPNETVEAFEVEEEKKKEPIPRKRSMDPRIRIRYRYREFLKYLYRLRVPVENTNTTGEIEVKSKDVITVDQEALDAFSTIYNRARYQQSENPSASDAEKMNELFMSIKQDHR